MWRNWVLGFCLSIVPLQVHADAFDRAKKAVRIDIGQADLSGFSLRGGAGLSTGIAPQATVILRGQAQVGGGCESFDFGATMKEAFESIPAALENLGQAILSNMPMLLLCYSSPSLCDLAKHFQAITSAIIQAKYGRCQQVQTMMAYAGLRLRGGAVAQCLEYQANHGATLSQAMATCNSTVDFLRLPDGSTGTQVDLVQKTLDAAGATTEMKQLAGNLLGEVTMRAQGSSLGIDQTRPREAMLHRYEAHRQAVVTSVSQAVDELRTTGQVSPLTLETLAAPGQALPLAALQALVALQPDQVRYQSYVQKLATSLALTRLTWECGELQEQLAGSIEANEHLNDEQRHLLERRLASLERELHSVRAKKRVIEDDLQPAVDALLTEYAKLQSVTTQAGFSAPRVAVPAVPYGTQMPSGYSQ